jgi:hypothetical protein
LTEICYVALRGVGEAMIEVSGLEAFFLLGLPPRTLFALLMSV